LLCEIWQKQLQAFRTNFLYIRDRSQITSRFRGEGVEELVTAQTQNFSFFGKFVTKGGGVKK